MTLQNVADPGCVQSREGVLDGEAGVLSHPVNVSLSPRSTS